MHQRSDAVITCTECAIDEIHSRPGTARTLAGVDVNREVLRGRTRTKVNSIEAPTTDNAVTLTDVVKPVITVTAIKIVDARPPAKDIVTVQAKEGIASTRVATINRVVAHRTRDGITLERVDVQVYSRAIAQVDILRIYVVQALKIDLRRRAPIRQRSRIVECQTVRAPATIDIAQLHQRSDAVITCTECACYMLHSRPGCARSFARTKINRHTFDLSTEIKIDRICSSAACNHIAETNTIKSVVTRTTI